MFWNWGSVVRWSCQASSTPPLPSGAAARSSLRDTNVHAALLTEGFVLQAAVELCVDTQNTPESIIDIKVILADKFYVSPNWMPLLFAGRDLLPWKDQNVNS
jgi:hypothetical protein